MIEFVRGIFYDQIIRGSKMLDELHSPPIRSKPIDAGFLKTTIQMLNNLCDEIQRVIDSGDLDIESLAPNNIIKYNTFHETLLKIELFRFAVIVNYDSPEEYFKKKIEQIYKEVNCLQTTPIVTTISNSESYYWALPLYDLIAVPSGEEKNLLNLPDLFHEMGHLIYNQYQMFLKGKIETDLIAFYNKQIQLVNLQQRSTEIAKFLQDKKQRWIGSWVMEFTCDLIATYLVGPAYAWTNLKLTTLSSGKNRVYIDSPSHPSDEARMRAIFYMLSKMGHTSELKDIELSWKKFLAATNNPVPANYHYIFPKELIERLADAVLAGCKVIRLYSYSEQISKFGTPISKTLNDAWSQIFNDPNDYQTWEKQRIAELRAKLNA